MTRSFRFQLAVRASVAAVVGLVALSVVSLITLRALLDQELNSSILNVASIQAASLADGPDGAFDFVDSDDLHTFGRQQYAQPQRRSVSVGLLIAQKFADEPFA